MYHIIMIHNPAIALCRSHIIQKRNLPHNMKDCNMNNSQHLSSQKLMKVTCRVKDKSACPAQHCLQIQQSLDMPLSSFTRNLQTRVGLVQTFTFGLSVPCTWLTLWLSALQVQHSKERPWGQGIFQFGGGSLGERAYLTGDYLRLLVGWGNRNK